MPPLFEMQAALRRSVLLGDKTAISAMLAEGVAAERIDIYRNTVVLTLARALRLGFPAVEKLVGADFFEGTARHFIAEHPPRTACLDLYGEAFPDFLQAFPPAVSVPYLADVARLEWAVSRALHAADSRRLDPSRLAEVAAEDVGDIRLVAEPSLSLLHLRYPADAIWRAVLDADDAALGKIDPGSGEVFLLIERQACGVNVARLSAGHWRFFADLCAGKSIEAAIDPTCDFDLSTALAEHLLLGRFASFELAPSPPETQT